MNHAGHAKRNRSARPGPRRELDEPPDEGIDLMRVLVWSTGVDTGGQGSRIGQAFARYSDWHVDVLNNARSPLGYPEEGQSPAFRRQQARTLYAQADVVHLRNTLDGWKQQDLGQGKPIVLHHHGSLFREGHGGLARNARAIGAVQIASTLDLTLLEPDVEWLPAPYSLPELAAMREVATSGTAPESPSAAGTALSRYSPRPDGIIRIAHFPTSKKVKSTDAFLAATESLGKRYPIEVLTNLHGGRVRHQPWSDVLAQKATADIYFDQIQLGYGNNAIEAWGMGIPVVAGVADPKVRALMVERFGRLPFLPASEDTIETALEALIQSRAMRDEYAQMGTEHVRRFHDEAVVVAQLQGIYSGAKPTVNVTLPRYVPSWRKAVA